MLKNDYRRAFIMLRSGASGYSGHARLERRTLTGSLYFIVAAPEGAGPLSAALLGQQGGQYYAAAVGTFARDRRGQLTLAWQFDPRDIEGRPLEAYAWVAVADTGGNCAVVLTGNVNGSREVDPAELERAVCRLFAREAAPAADLPGPDAPTGADSESDVKIYRPARARAAEAVPDSAKAAPPEPAPTPVDEPTPTDAPTNADATTPEDAPVPLPEPEALSADSTDAAKDAPERPETAAQVLGLDITAPWPAPAEPLRRLFATQTPAPNAPNDGYTYVASTMPKGGGYGDCLIGLKASDGAITGVRYALAGVYAPEPPAGLSDYRWDDGGYWVLEIGVS